MPIQYISTASFDTVIVSSSLYVSGTYQVSGSIAISGSLVVGSGGIKFRATAISSSNFYELDDYEEGEFTPAFNTNVGGTWTYSIQEGTYVKIGNIVNISFQVALSNATFGPPGGSTSVTITSLPFVARNLSNNNWFAELGWSLSAASSSVGLWGQLTQASTTLQLYRATAATSNPLATTLFQNAMGTTGYIQGSLTYLTN